jgi:hypothetical protein
MTSTWGSKGYVTAKLVSNLTELNLVTNPTELKLDTNPTQLKIVTILPEDDNRMFSIKRVSPAIDSAIAIVNDNPTF